MSSPEMFGSAAFFGLTGSTGFPYNNMQSPGMACGFQTTANPGLIPAPTGGYQSPSIPSLLQTPFFGTAYQTTPNSNPLYNFSRNAADTTMTFAGGPLRHSVAPAQGINSFPLAGAPPAAPSAAPVAASMLAPPPLALKNSIPQGMLATDTPRTIIKNTTGKNFTSTAVSKNSTGKNVKKDPSPQPFLFSLFGPTTPVKSNPWDVGQVSKTAEGSKSDSSTASPTLTTSLFDSKADDFFLRSSASNDPFSSGTALFGTGTDDAGSLAFSYEDCLLNEKSSSGTSSGLLLGSTDSSSDAQFGLGDLGPDVYFGQRKDSTGTGSSPSLDTFNDGISSFKCLGGAENESALYPSSLFSFAKLEEKSLSHESAEPHASPSLNTSVSKSISPSSSSASSPSSACSLPQTGGATPDSGGRQTGEKVVRKQEGRRLRNLKKKKIQRTDAPPHNLNNATPTIAPSSAAPFYSYPPTAPLNTNRAWSMNASAPQLLPSSWSNASCSNTSFHSASGALNSLGLLVGNVGAGSNPALSQYSTNMYGPSAYSLVNNTGPLFSDSSVQNSIALPSPAYLRPDSIGGMTSTMNYEGPCMAASPSYFGPSAPIVPNSIGAHTSRTFSQVKKPPGTVRDQTTKGGFPARAGKRREDDEVQVIGEANVLRKPPVHSASTLSTLSAMVAQPHLYRNTPGVIAQSRPPSTSVKSPPLMKSDFHRRLTDLSQFFHKSFAKDQQARFSQLKNLTREVHQCVRESGSIATGGSGVLTICKEENGEMPSSPHGVLSVPPQGSQGVSSPRGVQGVLSPKSAPMSVPAVSGKTLGGVLLAHMLQTALQAYSTHWMGLVSDYARLLRSCADKNEAPGVSGPALIFAHHFQNEIPAFLKAGSIIAEGNAKMSGSKQDGSTKEELSAKDGSLTQTQIEKTLLDRVTRYFAKRLEMFSADWAFQLELQRAVTENDSAAEGP